MGLKAQTGSLSFLSPGSIVQGDTLTLVNTSSGIPPGDTLRWTVTHFSDMQANTSSSYVSLGSDSILSITGLQPGRHLLQVRWDSLAYSTFLTVFSTDNNSYCYKCKDLSYEPYGSCMNLICNGDFDSFLGVNGATGNIPIAQAGLDQTLYYTCAWTTPLDQVNYQTMTAGVRHVGTPNLFVPPIYYPTNPRGTQTDPGSMVYDPILNYNPSNLSQAYAGFYTYASFSGTDQYREYIQQELRQPLQDGKTYNISIQLSLADKSNYATPVGILLTEDRPAFTADYNSMLLNYTPTFSAPIVTDKQNFQTVSFQYTHSGNPLKIITIGNFKSNADMISTGELDHLSSDILDDIPPYSFYYIDNISIIDVTAECCGVDDGIYLQEYNEYTPEPMVTSNINGCSDNAFQITNLASLPANSIFEWTFTDVNGNTTTVGTGSSVNIDLTQYGNQGGTLTLTYYRAYGCGGELEFKLYPCCLPDKFPGTNTANSIFVTGSPNLNSASELLSLYNVLAGQPNTNTTVSANLSINGVFTIDTDIQFFNNSVRMGKDAQIVVSDTKTFIIRTSHLQACKDMWKGILLPEPSSKVDMVKSSILEDAFNGIYSNKGATYFIENSILNKNQRAIVVNGSQIISNTPFNGIIRSSFISCNKINFTPNPTVDESSALTLNPPLDGQTSETGITFISLQVGGQIGDATMPDYLNTFVNNKNHILSWNSRTRVVNNKFLYNYQYLNMLNSGMLIANNNGVAIAGIGQLWNGQPVVSNLSSLTVGGDGDNEGNSFWMCGAAVRSFGHIKTNITQNYMGFGYLGVVCQKLTKQSSITINKNNFQYLITAGIWGVENYNFNQVSPTTIIKDNILDQQSIFGIYWSNSLLQKNLDVIANNQIKSSGTLFSPYPGLLYGIQRMNGIQSQIFDNTIEFVESPTTIQSSGYPLVGISYQNGMNKRIVNNTINRSNLSPMGSSINMHKLTGIVTSASPGGVLCGNTTKNLGVGINITSNNKQTRILNNVMQTLKHGVYLNSGDIYFAIPGMDKTGGNQWKTIYGTTNSNSDFRITGWYASNQSYTWYYNPITPDYDPLTPYIVPGGQGNIAIHEDRDNLSPNCQPLQVKSEYKELLYIQADTSSDSLSLSEREVHQMVSDSYLYYSLMNDDSLTTSERDSLLFLVKNKVSPAAIWLYSLTEALQEGKAADAKKAIEYYTQTAVSTPEKSLAEVLDVYAQTWLIDTLEYSTEQYDLLYQYATADEKEIGPVVTTAKVMLGLVDVPSYEMKSMKKQNQNENTEALIKIYPNPTNGWVQMELPLTHEGGLVSLFTMDGRAVYSLKLPPNSGFQNIDLHDLSSGMYIYTISLKGMKPQRGRLVLTKSND